MNKSRYAGAARFLEIAPPGIPYRTTVNVDHVVDISFTNKIEEVEQPIEGAEMIPAVIKDGVEITPARQPMQVVNKITGIAVNIGIAGQERSFTFKDPKIAIHFYYQLHDGIRQLGVPLSPIKPKIQPPPEPEQTSVIVGADGESIPDDSDENDFVPGIDGLEDDEKAEH